MLWCVWCADIHRGGTRQDDLSVQCNERVQLAESLQSSPTRSYLRLQSSISFVSYRGRGRGSRGRDRGSEGIKRLKSFVSRLPSVPSLTYSAVAMFVPSLWTELFCRCGILPTFRQPLTAHCWDGEYELRYWNSQMIIDYESWKTGTGRQYFTAL